MTIVLIDKDVGHGSQFQQLTLVFAFSGDSQRHSRDMASKSNANLATAAAYAGPLLLMLLATMVRGAHLLRTNKHPPRASHELEICHVR